MILQLLLGVTSTLETTIMNEAFLLLSFMFDLQAPLRSSFVTFKNTLQRVQTLEKLGEEESQNLMNSFASVLSQLINLLVEKKSLTLDATMWRALKQFDEIFN